MTRPEGAPRRPLSRVKKEKYVAGAAEGRGQQRNGDVGGGHLNYQPIASERDAGEEVKKHNVSHVDGGNFIKLRSSGV